MPGYSLEERQRRSDRAKKLHAEGKLGGRKPAMKSAEVRARRASELSAEIVEKHRQKIEKAIVDGLNSSSVSQRLKAAELALKMGMAGERLEASVDRAAHEHLDRAELLDLLSEKLTAGPAGAALRSRFEVIEGTAIAG